jgi:hypothetical protein
MRLPPEEGLLFYKLYPALLCYVNEKLQLVDALASDLEGYLAVPGELRLQVRNALHAHHELIDGFVRENPAHLAPDELAIVSHWKKAIVGNFYIFRYLEKYTVFLDDRSPPAAYGVVAVADPIQSLVGETVPILTKAVLLPFNGKIIYDGLLSSYRLSFGPGIRRRLNETYKRAKEINGIITSLPLNE